MIDSKFIIRYTDALYSVPEQYRPRYDEFRDMFSSGQIKSKEWAIGALLPYVPNNESVVIVGSWFGTLGIMLHNRNPALEIKLMDIDPRCEKFLHSITHWLKNVSAETNDMYAYKYTEDVVINTSCEHIPDLKEWLKLIPEDTIVLLQSNNNTKMDGHINCSASTEEFREKAGLTKVFYSGELIMPMYTRFMLVGKV